MICVYLCVCFRMYWPSQHSVCGAWHSSQGCVWSSLLFSDHYHCACFIGERVFGHLTPLQPPPPLPEACRHDNHGLRIASAARHWGGLGTCRCVCVWCIYRCSFVQWCMEIIIVFSPPTCICIVIWSAMRQKVVWKDETVLLSLSDVI